MNDRLEKALDEVKSDIAKGDSPDSPPKETAKVTTKKTTAKSAAAKKKAPVATASKKKAAKPEGEVITLKAIAKELKIEPRVARKKLRAAKIKNDGRWSWPVGSADVKKVREALTASAE